MNLNFWPSTCEDYFSDISNYNTMIHKKKHFAWKIRFTDTLKLTLLCHSRTLYMRKNRNSPNSMSAFQIPIMCGEKFLKKILFATDFSASYISYYY